MLKKTILESPWRYLQLKRSEYLDIFLNILGFIPLGFFLALGIAEIRRQSRRQVFLLTLFTGFSTSLVIEGLQVYLPSRSSSMMDLLLNTLGTVVGIVLVQFALSFEGLRSDKVKG
jgi:glycopeptide antibiotics resistance protein